MRKEYTAPAVAVLGGAAGFALRLLGLRTGFEPDTGLTIPGSPANLCLILLSAVMVLVLAALVSGFRRTSADYAAAFRAEGNTLYVTFMVLAAFALLGAAVLAVLEERGILPLLLAALCAASACCVFSVGRSNFRGWAARPYSLALLIPAYTCCLWLILAYQQDARDPVTLRYIYGLLAIICTLLGLYFTAGFSFSRPRPARTAFFSLLGVYFSMVSLADRPSRAFLLLHVFSILMPLISTLILLRNLSHPEAAGITKETDREELSDES